MSRTATEPAGWRIVRMSGGSGTHSHPWMAVTPGCPAERHPTRWCRCLPFRTADAATIYVRTRRAQDAERQRLEGVAR